VQPTCIAISTVLVLPVLCKRSSDTRAEQISPHDLAVVSCKNVISALHDVCMVNQHLLFCRRADNHPHLSFSRHGQPAYADTTAGIDFLCEQLLRERPSIVGLDAEWSPSTCPEAPYAPLQTAGLATIQLCYVLGGPRSTPCAGRQTYRLNWKCLVLYLVNVPGRMTCTLRKVRGLLMNRPRAIISYVGRIAAS
jgi:hypothetical protein